MIISRFADEGIQLGGWNLGRWGLLVNLSALIYTLWIMVFLPFPSTVPVTGANMNYAGPRFVLVLLTALIAWFVRARKYWSGPNMSVIDFVVRQE